jgi:hypothetical protein
MPTPHHADLLMGIELEQQPPLDPTWFEVGGPLDHACSNRHRSAAVAHQLAVTLHVALARVRLAEHPMDGLILGVAEVGVDKELLSDMPGLRTSENSHSAKVHSPCGRRR